jgi:hypothetical protein
MACIGLDWNGDIMVLRKYKKGRDRVKLNVQGTTDSSCFIVLHVMYSPDRSNKRERDRKLG